MNDKIIEALEDYISELEQNWWNSDSNSQMDSYRKRQDEIREFLQELHQNEEFCSHCGRRTP